MAKLLRKDVLKWIRNLSDGSYKKGKNNLVSPSGNNFCCLGVWANQHGCTWLERPDLTAWDDSTKELVPIAKDKVKPHPEQTSGMLRTNLMFGLKQVDLDRLADLNDRNKTWKQVIEYIKAEILPRAK